MSLPITLYVRPVSAWAQRHYPHLLQSLDPDRPLPWISVPANSYPIVLLADGTVQIQGRPYRAISTSQDGLNINCLMAYSASGIGDLGTEVQVPAHLIQQWLIKAHLWHKISRRYLDYADRTAAVFARLQQLQQKV